MIHFIYISRSSEQTNASKRFAVWRCNCCGKTIHQLHGGALGSFKPPMQRATVRLRTERAKADEIWRKRRMVRCRSWSAKYCWWFRNPVNQLRLVVFSAYLQCFIHPRWSGMGFLPSTVGLTFFLSISIHEIDFSKVLFPPMKFAIPKSSEVAHWSRQ